MPVAERFRIVVDNDTFVDHITQFWKGQHAFALPAVLRTCRKTEEKKAFRLLMGPWDRVVDAFAGNSTVVIFIFFFGGISTGNASNRKLTEVMRV
jgi:hypothetical protein